MDNAVLCFSLQLSNGIPVLPLLGVSKTCPATLHSLSSFDEVSVEKGPQEKQREAA